jgi:hypothetical protein
MASPYNSRAAGGHRGLLVVGGTVVTGVRGAQWNWNTRHADDGAGWGENHDYAVNVMPGAPTIDVEDPTWNPTQTVITDLARSMLTGTKAIVYLYPQGLDDVTKYCYGTFILDEPSLKMNIEEVIRLPFGLIAAASDCGSFGI